MKKKFMALVAMIMILATFATMLNFVSAEDAEAEAVPYIDATMSMVVVDGTLSAVHASNIEFLMETQLDNCFLGAAWEPTEAKLFLAVSAKDAVLDIDLTVGGATAAVSVNNGTIEGIDGAEVKANENGNIVEICVPINQLILKHNGSNVYTEAEITVNTTSEAKFAGNIIFRNYTPMLAFNRCQQSALPVSQVTIDDNFTARLFDDDTSVTTELSRKSGLFWAHNAITATKNMYIETNINIKAMPVTTPFVDNPSKWQQIPEARLWIAIRYTTTDQLFLDVINTADNGLQLLIQTDDSFIPSYEAVTLGKQTGEDFVLGLEWFDDCTLNVFVDGEKIYTTKNTVVKSSSLGQATGVIFFDTTRKSPLGVGETIDVEYYNFSVSQRLGVYDEAALIALSKEAVIVPETSAPETTTAETTTVAETSIAETTKAETTKAETTTTVVDTTVADTSAEESVADTTAEAKSGCGSSLVGYGITMVLGSTVMAVLATSKKKED